MTYKQILFLTCMLFLAISVPVTSYAQMMDQKKPIEVEAEQALEYVQNENKYVARGNAIARQGEQQIKADVISAISGKGKTDTQAIEKIIAEGKVVLSSPGYTAIGDRAEYDPKTGIMTLTGETLMLKTVDQTLTAKDYILYDQNKGELIAQGKAEVMRSADRMVADQIEVRFTQDAADKNKQKAEKILAQDNVVIYTKTEEIHGDRGVYNIKTDYAEITGNVEIRQGQNILKGGKAELNVKTGISKLFADTKTQTGTGRVKGTFFPE